MISSAESSTSAKGHLYKAEIKDRGSAEELENTTQLQCLSCYETLLSHINMYQKELLT